VRVRLLLLALWLSATPGTLRAADKKPPKELPVFGSLRTASADETKTQALAWLKDKGKADAGTLKKFSDIWSHAEVPLVDRLADTLALGDGDAAKLLADARDANKPAPTNIPAVLKDAKQPAFYRSNLALCYAKTLGQRRVYEEALDALKAAKVEQVADPATYLFNRAVAEHALLLKDEATHSIARLLDDAVDVPERYRMVSVLMALDMQSWREKDLGWIARKMNGIERRLELARGGPQTQKMQKEVVLRLDELIKQIENSKDNQANGGC
jgi:hypothetical protein